ncbi:MAG: FIST C-terminal domain-containing protein [Saprospiraceae bacterium]|nr:FIST C-terminal domain-containing protein [Saprospiraceae bacterium]
MKIVQMTRADEGWRMIQGEPAQLNDPLVLVFGNRQVLERDNIFAEVRALFPSGQLVFGSTSGDIIGDAILMKAASLTAIEFESATYKVEHAVLEDGKDSSHECGSALGARLNAWSDDLRYVLVIAEGSRINGSKLVKGINGAIDGDVLVTGGLCGDDDRFQKTLASYNEAPKEGVVVAVGLYGEVRTSFSIDGGWLPFGPERVVTRSKENVLYELDGRSALDLYKEYLGEKAKELPSSALLYPLNVKSEALSRPIVRTILNIDEENKSMILAGDIPEGSLVQLMMTNVDQIVNASEVAASQALQQHHQSPELVFCVSCIGRKIILDQRAEEEVEEVVAVVGNRPAIMGFYSYGELAPFPMENSCRLHNQTMNVTMISES